MLKTIVSIGKKAYMVGYPQCAGCKNYLGACTYPGASCEYPINMIISAYSVIQPYLPGFEPKAEEIK
jgi:hypothetical protein